MGKKNALYAQSGGVTAVINASACGVIEACRQHKDKIGTLYAGQNGILGILQEQLIDTSKELTSAITALKHTPGCPLYTFPSPRDRTRSRMPSSA